MLEPIYRIHFEKDLKRAKKRGKNLEKLKVLIRLLLEQAPLPCQYRDHVLSGNYKGRRECHIEPDWLLIYKLEGNAIIFERIGSHADLFK